MCQRSVQFYFQNLTPDLSSGKREQDLKPLPFQVSINQNFSCGRRKGVGGACIILKDSKTVTQIRVYLS